MALLDISQVTRSLLTLIEEHVTASQVWSPAVTLTVSPGPPDGLSGENTLGWYLYHISEDAGYKKTHVYWEGTTKNGEGDGEFKRVEKGDDCSSWVAYVVGEGGR